MYMAVGRPVCLDLFCTLPVSLIPRSSVWYTYARRSGNETNSQSVSQSVNVYVSAGESVLLRSDQVDGGGNVSIDMESVQRTQLQQLEQQVCRH